MSCKHDEITPAADTVVSADPECQCTPASEPPASDNSIRPASPAPSSLRTAVGPPAIAVPRKSRLPLKGSGLPAHMIVSLAGSSKKSAWGREGVARIGYHNFARMLFDAYFLHPRRAPSRTFNPFTTSARSRFWETYHFLRNDFVARVKLVPQFIGDPDSGESGSKEPLDGSGNVQTVSLQPVGWAEMIREVITIIIEYRIPDEYPGKEQLRSLIEPKTKS
ncbi:hypothetical protein GY45DRAFT_1324641 [Cubamyces sp. BRFM 1775]|nr:hypothetical protein GY45DRAFT_1324641 [Cubamyces sp. BRFM 1775]